MIPSMVMQVIPLSLTKNMVLERDLYEESGVLVVTVRRLVLRLLVELPLIK